MSIMDQLNINRNTIGNDKAHLLRAGVTLATVTDINDPEKLGRIKCTLLTANKEGMELDWAYMMTPFGGESYGFFFMPNVGDTVLVSFEAGEVGRPFILGCLWGKLLNPPLKLQDGKNDKYQLVTPQKNIIELSDEKGKEAISIQTPGGRKIAMDDGNKKIELTDGNNSITMDDNSGEVSIKCKSKLTIKVGSNASITIDGNTGAIEIQGQQAVKIKATQVEIEAQANAKLKSGAQLSVESSGVTTIKGSMLKLN